jgi:adenosylcobinamide-GDP ribazoletransferase
MAFLTPLGGAAVPDARTLGWFPAAGAVIGAVVGLVWWGADELWTPLVAASIAVLADLIVTGLLHTDGVADTADGLLPQVSRERRLEIMADPAVGAYGVVAVVVVLGVRVATLAALEPDVLLLAALWCASRTAMAVVARALPYARSDGLAAAFLGGPVAPVAASGAALSIVLAVLGERPAIALVGVGCVATGAALVAVAARRRLGGFTGDVLGAAGVVGETVALVAMAARW